MSASYSLNCYDVKDPCIKMFKLTVVLRLVVVIGLKTGGGIIVKEGFLRWENGGGTCHSSAQIYSSALVEFGAVVHEKAVLGAEVHVGSGTVIGPSVDIGPSTRIG